MSEKYPYPLTIVYDRYNGTYSGGIFTAWNLDCEDVPEAISDDDVSCADFWSSASDGYVVGKGSTPQEAIQNLLIGE